MHALTIDVSSSVSCHLPDVAAATPSSVADLFMRRRSRRPYRSMRLVYVAQSLLMTVISHLNCPVAPILHPSHTTQAFSDTYSPPHEIHRAFVPIGVELGLDTFVRLEHVIGMGDCGRADVDVGIVGWVMVCRLFVLFGGPEPAHVRSCDVVMSV